MMTLRTIYRRLRGTTQVVGSRRHQAEFLEEGLCRLKWVGVLGAAVKLTSAAVVLTTGVRSKVPSGLHPYVWSLLVDVLPMMMLLSVVWLANDVLSIRRARMIVLAAALGLFVPTAVGVGWTGLDETALPVLSISMLVGLMVLPMKLSEMLGVVGVTLAAAVLAACIVFSREDQPQWLSLVRLWFPVAIATLGIAVSQWYTRSFRTMWKAERLLVRRNNEIAREQRQIQRLLVSALPQPVAAELQTTGRFRSQLAEVCVIAVDIVGFSRHCQTMPAVLVVEELQRFFRTFEQCCQKYAIEPLRARGDGVLAIGGLWPEDHGQPRQPVIDAVLAMLEFRRRLSSGDGPGGDRRDDHASANLWPARIGIHIGPVVMGVIDGVRLSFDVWGDTVNTAARLEQGAGKNAILLSEKALWATRGLFEHGPLQELCVKESKIPCVAEVTGIAPEYRTASGEPSAAFWQVYHAAEHPPVRPAAGGTEAERQTTMSYKLPGSVQAS